ncbi:MULTISPECIES: right-handed parallel beta-helix repeat-containing protein [unclassified Micromonospora]|uniref:right-handed parallel beta-helix repeat-containing protein n=1 Tax=unclassified Micromonospora TaxID=2617518 RepID=UPI0033255D42
MRRSRLAGLAAVALIGGTLLPSATPAHAETSTLYVNNLIPEVCTDTGDGTVDQPFCTIGPAVAKVGPGQTVRVDGGPYAERVTVAASGTAEQPITLRAGLSATGGPVVLSGPTAGVVVHHQRHVTIAGFRIASTLEAPAVDIHDAGGIVLDDVVVSATAASTQPAFRLSAVTGSTVRRVIGGGPRLATGLFLDAASSGVTITSATFTNGNAEAGEGVGIDVAAADTRILASAVTGFRGAAIAVRPGAVDTVIANSTVSTGYGDGVQIRGATGTALSNNIVRDRCRNGVRVDGASDRISVQNNVVISNGGPDNTTLCESAPTDSVEIGVYGESRGKTVVDYNNTGQALGYAWDRPMTLAEFRAASGQGAHDIYDANEWSRVDSANSAAPGFPAKDVNGRGRGDDPSRANTGAGPVPWADRGPRETLAAPVVLATLTQEAGTGWVTVDASTTRAGFTPVVSYRFDFGDGTVVTQAGPVARHQYGRHGTFRVSVTATLEDTMTGARAYSVSFLPRAGTIGLLSLVHHRYVGVGNASHQSPTLVADRTALAPADAFDLVNVGTGQVALLAHHTGAYVSPDLTEVDVVTARSSSVGPNETFTMTRYADGSFSLKASNGRYVSAYGSGGVLHTSTYAVSLAERFHRVNVADANRSLRPAVVSQFVTADTAAAKPLVASSSTLGKNQRFDIVDLGDGKIALLAHANNRFVFAPDAGALPLVNASGAVSPWGTFTLVRNADGTVSLRAAVNNRYVSAGRGSSPLTASRTSISFGERFVLR